MESPTSDLGSTDGLTDASTPSTVYEPFEPRYKVKVSEPVKDGAYTLTVTKMKTGEDFSVTREYDDFEWLAYCLTLLKNSEGYLFPPLPPRPSADPYEGSNKSSKKTPHNGSGDSLSKDCMALQRYLGLVIAHSVFGMDRTLDKFLLDRDPPPRSKIKKGILDRLTSNMDVSRKMSHKDIDEYYQKEREWACNHAVLMRQASTAYSQMLNAMYRVASAYGHLSSALTMGGGPVIQGELNFKANRTLLSLSEALDFAKHGAEIDVVNDENTLAFHLDLYTHYAEALKSLHYNRLCLLIAYEDANKALTKAKPNKLTQAEEAKLAAERKFEECSGIARREIQNYHHDRVLAVQEALVTHTQAKIKTAKDTYNQLASFLAKFKEDQGMI